MRLITGPLRSGKTTALIAAFRAALPDATLLVPTATMAEHVRNTLIRSGLVLRPAAVTTLAKFAATLVPDANVVSSATLEYIVERILRSSGAYPAVADFTGFRKALVGAIEELAAAGVTPADLKGLDIDDFASIYRQVAAQVESRKLVFGIDRLRSAAEHLNGRRQAERFFLDGFYSFTPGELAVVTALASHCDVTAALPIWPGSERTIDALKSALIESAGYTPAPPDRVLIETRTIHDEVNAIAAAILAEHDRGTPYRDIGIIVRNAHQYGAAVRGSLERFRIPSRFYFAAPLRLHPTVRFLTGLIELVLKNWDNELALEILRLHDSKLEASRFGDLFEAKLRAGEWTRGFSSIVVALPQKNGVTEELRALEELRTARMRPAEWAKRLATLTELLAPPEIRDRIPHEEAMLWRERGQALTAYDESLKQAAEIAPCDSPVDLTSFWHVLAVVLDNAELRVNDHRRDVVHIIDAYEARQWNLPVVFVCGLLEGQFPKHHTEDPILPDTVRRALQSRGFQLPASSDRQRDEAFLFDIATTRASAKLILSYPRTNAKGDANLRSFVLDRFCTAQSLVPSPATSIRPEPALDRLPARRAEIYDESLHVMLRRSAAELGPTTLEKYLQCPFSYFIDKALRLESLPEKPAFRMNPPLQGNVIHKAIESVCRTKVGIDNALDLAFDHYAKEKNIPDSYKLEAIRLDLLYHVNKFFRETKLAINGNAELEFDVELSLDEWSTIRGRIDRIEFDDRGRPTIIDLKFKTPEKIRIDVKAHEAGRLVQGGLYLLAAQQRFGTTPAAMLYCSTKKQIDVRGWIADGPYRGSNHSDCTEQELATVMAESRRVALEALAQIRSGKIAPEPFDQTKCEYCSAANVCRWEVQQPVRIAGGVA